MNAPAIAATEHADPHWFARSAFSVIAIVFYVTELAIGIAVYHGIYWLAVPLALIAAHFMHGLLIGLHEASHGMLKRHRAANEAEGLIIGTLSFMSFTLYRVSHQTHHAYLGTERDEELWPFVNPDASRWLRSGAAFLELFFGLFYTPALFLRTFLRRGSPIRSPRIRRKIWREIALMAAVWIAILTAVAFFGLWKYFLWIYFVPAFIAGNLQSWRKYIEHVGLTGSTVKSGTRNIIADTPAGRFFSFTLLHEPYHGVHHLHAGLPHAALPSRAAELAPNHADEQAPFPSYRHAMVHLLKTLRDPKVGAQWRHGPNH